MHRREFLISGVAAVAAASIPLASGAAVPAERTPFRMRCAPHAGTFRNLAGEDPLDQIRWAADHGFAGFEDSGLAGRSPRFQDRFASALAACSLAPGPFVGFVDFSRPVFASGRRDSRKNVLRAVASAAECTQRTGAGWCTIVPGRADPSLPLSRQQANVRNLFEECLEACAGTGLGLLVEPVDSIARGIPMAVPDLAAAVRLCETIGSPWCRVLYDVYSQSRRGLVSSRIRPMTELASELDRAWGQVGAVQWGDSPGRKEPGTGTLDFAVLLRLLAARGYDGLIGMEHGNSQPGAEGEWAVLAAYRALESAMRHEHPRAAAQTA